MGTRSCSSGRLRYGRSPEVQSYVHNEPMAARWRLTILEFQGHVKNSIDRFPAGSGNLLDNLRIVKRTLSASHSPSRADQPSLGAKIDQGNQFCLSTAAKSSTSSCDVFSSTSGRATFRNDRKTEHSKTNLTSQTGFRNRAHSDRIRTDSVKKTILGACFVGWTECRQIRSLLKPYPNFLAIACA